MRIELKEYLGARGILNASFNLQGEPKVLTPKDALLLLNALV